MNESYYIDIHGYEKVIFLDYMMKRQTNIPFKGNVRFIDIIDFAKSFNFNTSDIQKLEDINELIRKAFLGDDDSLNILEELSNSALYKLKKADKRRSWQLLN